MVCICTRLATRKGVNPYVSPTTKPLGAPKFRVMLNGFDCFKILTRLLQNPLKAYIANAFGPCVCCPQLWDLYAGLPSDKKLVAS
jgi:hypothetical protein